MKLLEDRIKKDGIVLPGNILKVNSFLNHQIDVELLDKLAEDFKKSFDGVDITKVVTIEASGIAVACSVAVVIRAVAVGCSGYRERARRH